MTSHCLVTAHSSDVLLIRRIVGDSNVLGTPHFTHHCHLTMRHNKYLYTTLQ